MLDANVVFTLFFVLRQEHLERMNGTMKRLKFSKEKCIGCQLCAQVCSAIHEGMYIPSKARIGIETYYDRGGSLKYRIPTAPFAASVLKIAPQGPSVRTTGSRWIMKLAPAAESAPANALKK